MCLVGCQVSHTACSPHQPAGHGAQRDQLFAELCPSAHPWLRDPGAWQQWKSAPERVTELQQGRKKCFVPYWRLKCIQNRNECMAPAWRERSIFLIYHFWQGVQPECGTQVTTSSIKRWGVWQHSTVHFGVWDPPCDLDNKATAGSGAVLQAMAAISSKNTEAFLILQRQKWNPSLLMQCLPFLSRDQINMGPRKVNGLFQGALNWAL